VPPIRVVLAEMPSLLQDIVTALCAAESDVDVVARVGPAEDLEAAVTANRPDVLVTSADGPAALDSACLLFTAPLLRVLTIAEGGRVCQVERLVLERAFLRDVSPEELINAILDVDESCAATSDP
jgi:DNA-binding NarL/FixJ family response regulator